MTDACIARPQDKDWLSESGWLAIHEQLLARKENLRDTQLVFLGDSIAEAWLTDGREAWDKYFAKYEPLNLGIGGDETGQVLYRIEHGELDGIQPKVLVLLIGTNNVGNIGHDPKDVADAVKLIVQKIRAKLPATKILLLGVFPREANPNARFRLEVDKLNTRLRLLHDSKAVHYLDLAGVFLRADGTLPSELFPDTLHLSPKAYEVWAEAMMPTLRNLTE